MPYVHGILKRHPDRDMDFTHFLVFVMTVVIADDLFIETASMYMVKYYFK